MGDSRATTLLTTAYNQLQTNANKVTYQEFLHCFWNAPVHGKIRALMNAFGEELLYRLC